MDKALKAIKHQDLQKAASELGIDVIGPSKISLVMDFSKAIIYLPDEQEEKVSEKVVGMANAIVDAFGVDNLNDVIDVLEGKKAPVMREDAEVMGDEDKPEPEPLVETPIEDEGPAVAPPDPSKAAIEAILLNPDWGPNDICKDLEGKDVKIPESRASWLQQVVEAVLSVQAEMEAGQSAGA